MSESHTHTYIMPFGIVRKLLAEDERLAQLTPLWLEFLYVVQTLSGTYFWSQILGLRQSEFCTDV